MPLPTPSMNVANFARAAESVAFTGLTNNQFTIWIYGSEDTQLQIEAAEYFAQVADTSDDNNSAPNKQFGNLIRNDDLIYVPALAVWFKVTDETLGTVVAV